MEQIIDVQPIGENSARAQKVIDGCIEFTQCTIGGFFATLIASAITKLAVVLTGSVLIGWIVYIISALVLAVIAVELVARGINELAGTQLVPTMNMTWNDVRAKAARFVPSFMA